MMRLQIFYSGFIWREKRSVERRESRGVFWQDDSRQVGKSGKLRRGYIVWARRPGHDGGLSDAACAPQDRGCSAGEAVETMRSCPAGIFLKGKIAWTGSSVFHEVREGRKRSPEPDGLPATYSPGVCPFLACMSFLQVRSPGASVRMQ